jgi:hypothetical protein
LSRRSPDPGRSPTPNTDHDVIEALVASVLVERADEGLHAGADGGMASAAHVRTGHRLLVTSRTTQDSVRGCLLPLMYIGRFFPDFNVLFRMPRSARAECAGALAAGQQAGLRGVSATQAKRQQHTGRRG